MKTQDFDYALDPSRIAQTPMTPRDHSKLMVLSRATRQIQHRQFKELPALLAPGDTLVMNDTAVIPVRLLGRKYPSGGRIDCCLIKETGLNTWHAFIRGRVQVGQELEFSKSIAATVTRSDPETARKGITFHGTHNLRDQLLEIGLPPLPPYITRTPSPEDVERYQTVYAKVPGAIAAPTAGLHFTPHLLERLRNRHVTLLNVTLHTGLGTFLPVHAVDVKDHLMEPERFQVSRDTRYEIAQTKVRGGRVIAVGTTSVKTLETVAKQHASEGSHEGETALFIYPGFQFRAVDALITNFHLPKTTLLMLVCAFADKGFILHAYQEAIDHGYRFYSYGDAMLIL